MPSGEAPRKQPDDLKTNLGQIKHAQTVEAITSNLMVFKNYQTEEVSPKSTISQFDSGNSPTVKLTKYRWVKHAKPRKSSLDLKPASQFGKGPVASPSHIESDSESEEIHTSSRRIAQLNKEMGVLHVDKNLKYVHKLKRNPILKDTLLGKIVSVPLNLTLL